MNGRDGMKQRDIKKCAKCGKGVMHTGLPLFWRVTIERFGLNRDAIHRQAGLEMMIGGQLAAVMGPDEDMASPITEPVKLILCEDCAMIDYPVAAFAELEV